MCRLVELGGEGEFVLLLHGFGADRQSFIGNVSAITDNHQIWGLDLSGHGSAWETDPVAGVSGLASQIEEALAMCDKTPVHIVGHSLGGALAIVLAHRIEQVKSLTLLAPMGLGFGVATDFLLTFPTLRTEQPVLEQLGRLVCDKRLISPLVVPLVLEYLEKPGVRERLQHLAASLVGGDEPEITQAIKDIVQRNVSRLTIWGKNDAINPYNKADKVVFGGDWHVISECGHIPHIEHRIRVNRAIKDHLNLN